MSRLPTTRLSRADLADLNNFMAVEKHRSFSKAAIAMGVSTSAISHSVRNLESRLNVRLLNRTTRTVSPTDAGANLATRLGRGFEEIGAALSDMGRHRGRPVGRLRINVLTDGARLLFTKWLPKFLDAYPEVAVEVVIEDRMMDIVGAGFDAGIRYGGTIAEDFIAVPVSNQVRWVAIASPKYLEHAPKLEIPEDLSKHNCIQIRTGTGAICQWDFDKGDDYRSVSITGKLCVNETQFGIDMALADCGIFYAPEDRVVDHVLRGDLEIVLPEWTSIGHPFYIYYPSRRQMPPGLREFIDLLREESVTWTVSRDVRP